MTRHKEDISWFTSKRRKYNFLFTFHISHDLDMGPGSKTDTDTGPFPDWKTNEPQSRSTNISDSFFFLSFFLFFSLFFFSFFFFSSFFFFLSLSLSIYIFVCSKFRLQNTPKPCKNKQVCYNKAYPEPSLSRAMMAPSVKCATGTALTPAIWGYKLLC